MRDDLPLPCATTLARYSSLGLMRNFACLLLAASICSSAYAQTSVAERVAQQNALFEEFYQAGLKSSPERATSVGD